MKRALIWIVAAIVPFGIIFALIWEWVQRKRPQPCSDSWCKCWRCEPVTGDGSTCEACEFWHAAKDRK